MKRIILTMLFVFAFKIAYSQQMEDKIYHLNIMSSVGSGNLTNNQLGVLNGNYFRLGLHLDSRILKDTFLDDIFISTGLGFTQFSGNFIANNQSVNINNRYIDLPLMINFKEYFDKEKKLIFIISGGLSLNYLFDSNQKSINNNQNLDVNGFNLGRIGRTGIEYLLTNKYYLGIAYHYYGDFTKIEKNGVSNSLNNVNSVNISIGFRR